MSQADEPLFFYNIQDCDFCNCKGIISVYNDLTNENSEIECPICQGRGSLKLDPRRKNKDV